MPVVSPAMFRGDRWLYSPPGRGNRLDGSDHGPNEGLEDAILSREMVFSLPDSGNGRTFTSRFPLFLRRKGLLSRRASYLGSLSSGLSNGQAALYHWRPGVRAGVLLGVCAP